MKKRWIITVVFLLLLVSCSPANDYIRDDSKGEIIEISLEQWGEMMDNKERFLVVFSQLYCYGCNLLHTMLDSYLVNHNITLHEIILDYEPASPIENQELYKCLSR